MIIETKIKFIRGGLITSFQGSQIKKLQHEGVTTSGPMDNFLSKIGNITLNNSEDSICFEICKFGPIIQIVKGKFIFLISGNINFNIKTKNGIIDGESNQSYEVIKGDIIEINDTIDSNYAYLAFKGKIKNINDKNLTSSIISSSLGLNNGNKIYDEDIFSINTISKFKHRKIIINLNNYYNKNIRVINGPQMNYFKIKDIQNFFQKKFKISKNLNRVGIRLLNNPIKPMFSSQFTSEGIIRGSIQVPSDGNPIILTAEHPTIGGYPKIASIIMADFCKISQLIEGSFFNFEQVSIEIAENEIHKFNKKLINLKKNIVYL